MLVTSPSHILHAVRNNHEQAHSWGSGSGPPFPALPTSALCSYCRALSRPTGCRDLSLLVPFYKTSGWDGLRRFQSSLPLTARSALKPDHVAQSFIQSGLEPPPHGLPGPPAPKLDWNTFVKDWDQPRHWYFRDFGGCTAYHGVCLWEKGPSRTHGTWVATRAVGRKVQLLVREGGDQGLHTSTCLRQPCFVTHSSQSQY